MLEMLNSFVYEMRVQAVHVGRFFNRVERDGIANGLRVQITVKDFSLLSVVVKEKLADLKIKTKN